MPLLLTSVGFMMGKNKSELTNIKKTDIKYSICYVGSIL